MRFCVGIALANSNPVGTLTSKSASGAVFIVEVGSRIFHGRVARKVEIKPANGRRILVRRDDEVRSKAKPGPEVPLWDPANFTRRFVSRLLPHGVMNSPIMTAIVRACLVVGAFADAGT